MALYFNRIFSIFSMILTIPFRNSRITVKDEGSGKAVLLLHGYLESMDIWGYFARQLTRHYRVVSIDIPGHGQSGVIAVEHSMSLMAEAVAIVLHQLQIPQCVIIGHSMGGYVSLACLAEFPDQLAGICLFHSSPFADSEEKRMARAKEIRLIEAGKLSLICNISIPNSFAEENLQVMDEKVELVKNIACQTSPEGAIAILEGMRNRPDRNDFLCRNIRPVQFILGKKDDLVTFDELYPVALSYPNTTVNILEHSGHLGFLEEPENSVKFVLSFLEKCYA